MPKSVRPAVACGAVSDSPLAPGNGRRVVVMSKGLVGYGAAFPVTTTAQPLWAPRYWIGFAPSPASASVEPRPTTSGLRLRGQGTGNRAILVVGTKDPALFPPLVPRSPLERASMSELPRGVRVRTVGRRRELEKSAAVRRQPCVATGDRSRNGGHQPHNQYDDCEYQLGSILLRHTGRRSRT